MASSFVIACVGKPSAGKSSFLNAATDANAKVGNFPFTTIEPNQGIGYYPVTCPCARYGASSRCKPRHGSCTDGQRLVPIRLLDVAGLVPGASEGRGLGNKFLDDLRHADVLIHVVDASGTTDEQGKETRGYDPINDITWLRSEIEAWVYGNMERKWGGTVRRHLAVKATAVETLHGQLAGYGTTREVVQRALDKYNQLQGTAADLAKWDLDALRAFVAVFLDQRFPTIVALNKIDAPEADKNISAIMRRYRGSSTRGILKDGVSEENIVLTSALAECFLRKMQKQSYIEYETGKDDFYVKEDGRPSLKPVDDKVRRRLENIRDLVLFRYGSTGVQETLVRAVETLGYIPVYPVKSLAGLSSKGEAPAAPASASAGFFHDCVLVRPGTTVREFAGKLHNQAIASAYAGAETVGGVMLAEDDVIVPGKNNIIRYSTKDPAAQTKK
ncbi:hypothetical protein GGI07_002851 [Coemansia sp. Benny D115]|nr:hypothetical protein GGI07_002851 [Coemansia sp. Benny D115]